MSHTRLTWVFAVLALSGLTAMAQVTRGLTVDQLVQAALDRNRDYLAAKQRLAEAQGLLRQAGVRPAPTIEVEGSTGRPLGTVGESEFTVGYFRPIETFRKREKRVEVAEKSVDLAQAEVSERARQLTLEVKTRYIDAIAQQQKLQILDRVLGTGQEYFQLTKARVDRGDAAPLEAELFSTDLSRTEAEKIISTGRLESTLADLKQSVALATGDTLDVSGDLNLPQINLGLAELQDRAKNERPDLRAATILESQAKAELVLMEAEGHPDITLSARYTHLNSRFDAQGSLTTPLRDSDNILTFGVAVPFLSQKRNQGNIEAARARLAAAHLRREHLASTIALEVEAAFRRWLAARRAVDLLNTGVVDRSQRNLQVVRQAYNLGQLRMLDVLNEQRRVLDTELSFVDARAEAAKALAELERALGGSLK